MNSRIALLAALAFIFSAANAYADSVMGTVSGMDFSTIVLEDGMTFAVGKDVSTEGLEPGTRVIVVYRVRGGQKVATVIMPLSANKTEE